MEKRMTFLGKWVTFQSIDFKFGYSKDGEDMISHKINIP